MKLRKAPAGALVELVDDVPHTFGVILNYGRSLGLVPVDLWDEPAALVPADAEVRILSAATESDEAERDLGSDGRYRSAVTGATVARLGEKTVAPPVAPRPVHA